MFRPSALFDFVVCIHIFYLFLVFANHGKASDATELNEFGCVFSDNSYNVKLADNKQPEWSNRKIDSKYRVDDFENIEEPFKKLFSEVNIMNTLSLFTQLIRAYKNSNSTSFESFFNNYQVPFQHKKQYYDWKNVQKVIRKTQDPASYLIQELHTLENGLKNQQGGNQKWIRQEKDNERENTPLNTPYLVSAYVDPVQITFSKYNLHQIAQNVSQDLEKLHGKHVQDHLAGIIPIYIGNRTGYILIDPGYANGGRQLLFLPFAVYVMNDGKTPHGDHIRGTKSLRKEIVVKDDVNGNPFILAKHENRKISNHTHTYVVYSIGKPYCSFMENTIKLNLVRPYHEIVKQDIINDGIRNRLTMDYLEFKITPGSKKFDERFFTRTNDSLKPTDAFETTIQSTFFKNSSSTKEVSVIIDQLKFIQTHLFDDRDFVAQLTGFTKSLGLEPEPKDKSALAEHIPQLSTREKINKVFKKIVSC